MKGRKNCRVMGKISDVNNKLATNVFVNGPGDSITLREKIPTIARNNHCPSYNVHLCSCNDLIVSAGENEVCNAAIEEAGDCRLRNFDRSLRLTL